MISGLEAWFINNCPCDISTLFRFYICSYCWWYYCLVLILTNAHWPGDYSYYATGFHAISQYLSISLIRQQTTYIDMMMVLLMIGLFYVNFDERDHASSYWASKSCFMRWVILVLIIRKDEQCYYICNSRRVSIISISNLAGVLYASRYR